MNDDSGDIYYFLLCLVSERLLVALTPDDVEHNRCMSPLELVYIAIFIRFHQFSI